MDAINNVDLDTLKDYLTRLEKLEDYNDHLQEHGKNDSITSIKNYLRSTDSSSWVFGSYQLIFRVRYMMVAITTNSPIDPISRA